MALRLITEGEFRSSRYGSLADQIEGRLSTLIEQAESYIESKVDRVLSRTEYIETPDIGRVTLFMRQTPIISVEEILVNGTPIDPSKYFIAHDGTIELFNPVPSNARVIVRYTAGFDPIPPIIKAATIQQTAYFAYQDFEIYGSGDGKPPGIMYMQQEVDSLISTFKRTALA